MSGQGYERYMCVRGRVCRVSYICVLEYVSGHVYVC